jgi:hypothetical protein
MSWARLAFRVRDPSIFKPTHPSVSPTIARICTRINSWDGHVAQVVTRDGAYYTPQLEVHHAVLREDIVWVNTEAASCFPFAQAGVRILGIGYAADRKLEAFEASNPK